jgi:hypothetical protein
VAEKGAPSFVRYLSIPKIYHLLQLSGYRASASLSLPSRDEKPVTASPLESTLTNCDARNLFRICLYENCRVSLSLSPLISLFSQRVFHNSFPLNGIRTLSKNSRVSGLYSHSETRHHLEVFFSGSNPPSPVPQALPHCSPPLLSSGQR